MLICNDFEFVVLPHGRDMGLFMPPIEQALADCIEDSNIHYSQTDSLTEESVPMLVIDQTNRRIALLAVGAEQPTTSIVLEGVAKEVFEYCEGADELKLFEVDDEDQLHRCLLLSKTAN